jgi:DNA-binding transcriptional LysR family regulator
MNLHRLRFFLEVARHRNFSRVAEAMHVTQPAVSSQLRRLEEDLGVRLFWHAGRVTRLTEAGEALKSYAERILALAEEATLVVQEFGEMKRGHLRLAATTTPGTYLLPQLLGAFRNEWPNLEMTLTVGNHAEIIAQLVDFNVDLAVIAGSPGDQPALHSTPILDDELGLIAAPDSDLALRNDWEAEDLANETFFLRERGSGTLEVLETRMKPVAIHLNTVIQLPGTEAIKQAVMAGQGYAIVSTLAIRRELKDGTLVLLDTPWPRVKRRIHLVYHKSKFITPMIQRFIELVSDARNSVLAVGPGNGISER